MHEHERKTRPDQPNLTDLHAKLRPGGAQSAAQATSERANTRNSDSDAQESRLKASIAAAVVLAEATRHTESRAAIARFAREWAEIEVGPDDGAKAVVDATARLLHKHMGPTARAIDLGLLDPSRAPDDSEGLLDPRLVSVMEHGWMGRDHREARAEVPDALTLAEHVELVPGVDRVATFRGQRFSGRVYEGVGHVTVVCLGGEIEAVRDTVRQRIAMGLTFDLVHWPVDESGPDPEAKVVLQMPGGTIGEHNVIYLRVRAHQTEGTATVTQTAWEAWGRDAGWLTDEAIAHLPPVYGPRALKARPFMPPPLETAEHPLVAESPDQPDALPACGHRDIHTGCDDCFPRMKKAVADMRGGAKVTSYPAVEGTQFRDDREIEVWAAGVKYGRAHPTAAGAATTPGALSMVQRRHWIATWLDNGPAYGALGGQEGENPPGFEDLDPADIDRLLSELAARIRAGHADIFIEHATRPTAGGEPRVDIDRDMLEWAAEMRCEMEADDEDDYDPKVCSKNHTGRCWPCEARVRLAEGGVGGERARWVVDIELERRRQDDQWGGAGHDDQHSIMEWLSYIRKQTERCWDARSPRDHAEQRNRLIKVAALAVAGIESHDREHGEPATPEPREDNDVMVVSGVPPEGLSPETAAALREVGEAALRKMQSDGATEPDPALPEDLVPPPGYAVQQIDPDGPEFWTPAAVFSDDGPLPRSEAVAQTVAHQRAVLASARPSVEWLLANAPHAQERQHRETLAVLEVMFEAKGADLIERIEGRLANAQSETDHAREDAAAAGARTTRLFFARVAGLGPGHEVELGDWIRARVASAREPQGNVKLARGIEEHGGGRPTFDVPEGYDLIQMERGGWRFVSLMYGMPSTAAQAAREHKQGTGGFAPMPDVQPEPEPNPLPEGARWNGDAVRLANGTEVGLDDESDIVIVADDGSWSSVVKTLDEARGAVAVLARATGAEPSPPRRQAGEPDERTVKSCTDCPLGFPGSHDEDSAFADCAAYDSESVDAPPADCPLLTGPTLVQLRGPSQPGGPQ